MLRGCPRRPQSGGVPSEDKGFFRCGRPRFLEFMVCPHGQGGRLERVEPGADRGKEIDFVRTLMGSLFGNLVQSKIRRKIEVLRLCRTKLTVRMRFFTGRSNLIFQIIEKVLAKLLSITVIFHLSQF